MGNPEKLKHLPPWAADALRVADAEHKTKGYMEASRVRVFDLTKQAHELDKTLTHDLNVLMTAIQDPKVPIERRAKLLEVVILRGADNRMSYEALEAFWQKPKMEYQLAAMTAVMSGPPALFQQLSKSADHLPTGRAPATEWMNTMLREGGLAGNFERRQSVETWLKDLPAETRGHAMYHLRDAADAKEIGKIAQLTGFEVGYDSVGVGIQWEPGPDTHWKQVGDDLLLGVTRDLDKKPDQQAAFYTGYMNADPALDDPKEAAKGGK